MLGHVDHGKTSLLDRIRGSSVVKSEVGAITQHIGATMVPIDAIRLMSGAMGKLSTNVPGLLFIDTPGHQAFTTLRARGGALADMAIVVVDINQGFQPQTIEALQILRACKTPFVLAATKMDKLHGWRPNPGDPFSTTFSKQNDRVKEFLEKKIYEIVGELSDLDFSAERFDRVNDFQRNLAIVPVSAHTGEGIAELLMVMIGLAQRYMEDSLALLVDGPGKGTVLEVKEERGLGTTLDVILYDGTLSVGDEIAAATQDGPIITKVRSLLKPRPMKEILVEDRFERVKSVTAAVGISLTAPDLEEVIAGSPIRVIRGDPAEAMEEIRREMEDIHVEAQPGRTRYQGRYHRGPRGDLQRADREEYRRNEGQCRPGQPSRHHRDRHDKKPLLSCFIKFQYCNPSRCGRDDKGSRVCPYTGFFRARDLPARGRLRCMAR